MNSRERILASINHKQPDRVAIDLGATTSSGISAIAYNNLKRYLGINEGSTHVYDVVQQLARPEENILNMFNIDVVDIGRVYNDKVEDWYEIELWDGNKVKFPHWFQPVREEDGSLSAYGSDGTKIGRMPTGATFFDQTIFPYLDDYPASYKNLEKDMNKVIWDAFPASPWDYQSEAQFWEKLRERAIDLRENTDRALVIGFGGNLFEWGTYLRRMDNFLMDIYSCPEDVERFLDALLEKHMASLEKVCQYLGDVVDIIRFCDDLGMDQAPFMAPEIYAEIFKPRLAMMCDYVKKHSTMHTFIHSCGSIYKVIPHLIEAGIEIINPVQTTANEMDPATLKKEFGKDITFWGGGCNTRTILNRAKPQEVKDYVTRQLEIFAPGGGFVFNQEHNIMPDVPPENIIAMYEAVKEFKY